VEGIKDRRGEREGKYERGRASNRGSCSKVSGGIDAPV